VFRGWRASMHYLTIVHHYLVYWLRYNQTCQASSFGRCGICTWVCSLSFFYLIRFLLFYTLQRLIIFVIDPLAMCGISMSGWSHICRLRRHLLYCSLYNMLIVTILRQLLGFHLLLLTSKSYGVSFVVVIVVQNNFGLSSLYRSHKL
jgi:hypothetical protein